MAIARELFEDYVRQFRFRELFNEMGWNDERITQLIAVDGQNFNLQGVAEKSGFKIFVCETANIPDYNLRKKIESKITKLFQEHLIIFCDRLKGEQIWQLAVRQIGKPMKITETRFNISQQPELLYQRASGLFFELDEEDKITIVDVTKRISENFQANSEKITKQFYDKFKSEYNDFSKLIKGIDDSEEKRNWYASLMIDRLMFCYFIQKKGFLDNNKNYLRDKLNESRIKRGKDKFYSFYRDFLLVLFHEGIGKGKHSEDLKREIGIVPYLNGGLFDVHEIEKTYNNIQINDEAFERIFDFFDQYEWHLDTRPTSSGREINPDVLGYIFEKYINDRASMGAYYTKEDITDYISKNSIIPFLFNEVKKNYPRAFAEDSFVWRMLRENGDAYIYDSVKYGIPQNTKDIFSDLPEDIKIGLDTKAPNLLERRKNWNKPAPSEVALPTEIWREVIERRKHYQEVKQKIENGEIKEINDFITYNLNIRQFTQDVIENTEDSDFIKEFYKVLTSITVLDPTCGSGAFLFAALNILEDLYESCLMRMRNFVQESPKGKFAYFEGILNYAQSPQHPNITYFIYKSIILRNLYGVDIMNEAVEIAKLRLFLKLVSTVNPDYKKPNLGLEPLPDIDFNIRAGNTLIGFVSEEDVRSSIPGNLDFDGTFKRIQEDLDIVNKASERYKEIQLIYGDDAEEFSKAKAELNDRLKVLNKKLSAFLQSRCYDYIENYDKWLADYKPFHWLAEFYEIIKEKGGFDVIIGNPPYVEYSKVRDQYKIKDYKTESCGNLYAFIIERSLNILKQEGWFGMIVPISGLSNQSMNQLQLYLKSYLKFYLSNFHQRPAQLFEGVLQRLSVILLQNIKNENSTVFTTTVNRWNSRFREFLFNNLIYASVEQTRQLQIIKVGNNIEVKILEKIFKHKTISSFLSKEVNGNLLSYRTAGGGYWLTFLNSKFDTSSLSNKIAYFDTKFNSKVFMAILNSNLYWWYYYINYDLFNLKDYMIFSFMFNYPSNTIIEQKLIKLSNHLEDELLKNATHYVINSKTRGLQKTITYNKQKSKATIDEIDCVLAEHYGFTEEELDFIINYDIKFRMGDALEENEE